MKMARLYDITLGQDIKMYHMFLQKALQVRSSAKIYNFKSVQPNSQAKSLRSYNKMKV
jgi:hypothetical protein